MLSKKIGKIIQLKWRGVGAQDGRDIVLVFIKDFFKNFLNRWGVLFHIFVSISLGIT